MNPFEVLLIEDNKGDLTLIQEAFGSSEPNFHCINQKDGEKAIQYLNEMLNVKGSKLPDLVLLDLNLPRKNGFEVLDFIKTHPALKIIPTIVFTTSSSHKDITECYKRHANCYITKPAEIEKYLEVIQGIQQFWMKFVSIPTDKDRYGR